MKNLEARFKRVEERNPYFSSFNCFADATRKQKFSRKIISKNFKKLVDISDYNKIERQKLVEHIFFLSWEVEK